MPTPVRQHINAPGAARRTHEALQPRDVRKRRLWRELDRLEGPVLCSNRHRLPLLARAMSRYVPRSALFDQGNRNERADYLDLAR